MGNLNKHITLLAFLKDWDSGLFTLSMEDYFDLPDGTRRTMQMYRSMKNNS
jgi:hypothetical protein